MPWTATCAWNSSERDLALRSRPRRRSRDAPDPRPRHGHRALQVGEHDGLLENGAIAELRRQARRAVARAEHERNAACGQPEGEGIDDFAGEVDVEHGEVEVEAAGGAGGPGPAGPPPPPPPPHPLPP